MYQVKVLLRETLFRTNVLTIKYFNDQFLRVTNMISLGSESGQWYQINCFALWPIHVLKQLTVMGNIQRKLRLGPSLSHFLLRMKVLLAFS